MFQLQYQLENRVYREKKDAFSFRGIKYRKYFVISDFLSAWFAESGIHVFLFF